MTTNATSLLLEHVLEVELLGVRVLEEGHVDGVSLEQVLRFFLLKLSLFFLNYTTELHFV